MRLWPGLGSRALYVVSVQGVLYELRFWQRWPEEGQWSAIVNRFGLVSLVHLRLLVKLLSIIRLRSNNVIIAKCRVWPANRSERLRLRTGDVIRDQWSAFVSNYLLLWPQQPLFGKFGKFFVLGQWIAGRVDLNRKFLGMHWRLLPLALQWFWSLH